MTDPTQPASINLNVGGGYKRYPNFVNLDSDPLTKPEYLIDAGTDTWPIPDNSVKAVKCYHVMEHIEGVGYFKFMQELYRVCADGALIEVQVPHHRSETQYGDPSHVRFVTLESLRQFSKKRNLWHTEHWKSSSGFGIKLDVDFEIVSYDLLVNARWEERFKSMSQDEIMEVSCNFNNVYDELHVVLQVVKA
jgi:hypothetical protein